MIPRTWGLCHSNWVGFNYHKLRIPHELPCLEGVLVYTSQKEARNWQRHWLARKGRKGGLAEHQEGREKGGAHCLDMDKSVRRATSLALAGSYAQACRLVLETGS